MLAELDNDNLLAWAETTMIDWRWQGATGAGAFWAAASAMVNGAALAELRSRPLFVVM